MKSEIRDFLDNGANFWELLNFREKLKKYNGGQNAN